MSQFIFQPFPVRVHLRRVCAPNQDFFRTVDQVQDFQPEVKLLPYLPLWLILVSQFVKSENA